MKHIRNRDVYDCNDNNIIILFKSDHAHARVGIRTRFVYNIIYDMIYDIRTICNLFFFIKRIMRTIADLNSSAQRSGTEKGWRGEGDDHKG